MTGREEVRIGARPTHARGDPGDRRPSSRKTGVRRRMRRARRVSARDEMARRRRAQASGTWTPTGTSPCRNRAARRPSSAPRRGGQKQRARRRAMVPPPGETRREGARSRDRGIRRVLPGTPKPPVASRVEFELLPPNQRQRVGCFYPRDALPSLRATADAPVIRARQLARVRRLRSSPPSSLESRRTRSTRDPRVKPPRSSRRIGGLRPGVQRRPPATGSLLYCAREGEPAAHALGSRGYAAGASGKIVAAPMARRVRGDAVHGWTSFEATDRAPRGHGLGEFFDSGEEPRRSPAGLGSSATSSRPAPSSRGGHLQGVHDHVPPRTR